MEELIGVLREVREAHGLTQQAVADCMGMAKDQYRHVEKGRRPLPDIQHGFDLWIESFQRCVDASQDEKRRIFESLIDRVVSQFSFLIDDELEPPDDTSEPSG